MNHNTNPKTNKPSTTSKPGFHIRHDGGGAPGPNYTIPCPPKPKK